MRNQIKYLISFDVTFYYSIIHSTAKVNRMKKDKKSKLPFVVIYTQEMSDKFNKELRESGKCPIKNPDFYGKWNMLEVGTPEYELAIKRKRKSK